MTAYIHTLDSWITLGLATWLITRRDWPCDNLGDQGWSTRPHEWLKFPTAQEAEDYAKSALGDSSCYKVSLCPVIV